MFPFTILNKELTGRCLGQNQQSCFFMQRIENVWESDPSIEKREITEAEARRINSCCAVRKQRVTPVPTKGVRISSNV